MHSSALDTLFAALESVERRRRYVAECCDYVANAAADTATDQDLTLAFVAGADWIARNTPVDMMRQGFWYSSGLHIREVGGLYAAATEGLKRDIEAFRLKHLPHSPAADPERIGDPTGVAEAFMTGVSWYKKQHPDVYLIARQVAA